MVVRRIIPGAFQPASCYKEVAATINHGEITPVVNCLFNEDSAWSVHVSLSTGSSSSKTIVVQDAVVKVFAEQINVYSNIENGRGMFAGVSKKRLRIH
jgi:hypothetical protein